MPNIRSTSGCTSCGSQHTTTLDGVHGRRCANCPPGFNAKHWDGLAADGLGGTGAYARTLLTLPPGGYQPELADHMVDLGCADAAFTYLRAWLAAECNRRFAAAGAAR